MYTLEPAKTHELDLCIAILREGRAFQQEQGFTQWTDDYPTPALIEQDIREQQGYLFKIDGEAAGYMYLSFDGDPTYPSIEGKWLSDIPYIVVHRIALSRRFAGQRFSFSPIRLSLCAAQNNDPFDSLCSVHDSLKIQPRDLRYFYQFLTRRISKSMHLLPILFSAKYHLLSQKTYVILLTGLIVK